jgi:hypothetical protein
MGEKMTPYFTLVTGSSTSVSAIGKVLTLAQQTYVHLYSLIFYCKYFEFISPNSVQLGLCTNKSPHTIGACV